jgi:predicted HTH transcriptional regulator
MTTDELKQLIQNREGLKLEFKRTFHLNKKKPPLNTSQQVWSQFVEGQWHEFMKDIIGIANGNVGVPNQVGRIIIGVGNTIDDSGNRELFDTSDLEIDEKQIISKLNDYCDPPIPDLTCRKMEIDEVTLTIISVPPTPYVHETKRELRITTGNFNNDGSLASFTEDKTYTVYTAFIRKGESTLPASQNERRALEVDKKFDIIITNQSLRAELVNNLQIALAKTKKGEVFPSSLWVKPILRKHKIETGVNIIADKDDLKYIWLSLLYCKGKNLSTDMIDYAITSGKYILFNPEKGIFERSVFHKTLARLKQRIERYTRNSSNANDLFIKLSAFQGQRAEIKHYDLVSIVSMAYLIEDICNLSKALIEYIDGNTSVLSNIRLNPSTPDIKEAQKIDSEAITEAEVERWIQS